jgi:hypothetical protein
VKKAEKKKRKNKNNLTWAGPLDGAMHAGPNPSRNKRELGFPELKFFRRSEALDPVGNLLVVHVVDRGGR